MTSVPKILRSPVRAVIRIFSNCLLFRVLHAFARLPVGSFCEASRFRLADACFLCGDFDRADRYFARVTDSRQLARRARLHRDWIAFHRGDYSVGWPRYPGNADFEEAQFATADRTDRSSAGTIRVARPNYPEELETQLGLTRWQPGAPAPAGPLLVWFNFGNSLGGEILCGRLVQPFAEQVGIRLILAVSARHLKLFQASFPALEVVDKEQDLSALDPGCLHYMLSRDMARAVIRQEGDFAPIAAQRMQLPPCATPAEPLEPADALHIGVSWKTTNSDQARYRNIPVKGLAAVLARHPAVYHAAQHGDIAADRPVLERTLGDRIQFDTLALKGDADEIGRTLRRLDALITIDNSQLHIAGALGVHTLALLSIPAYWAWPDHGQESHWYDSVKILRQRKALQWASLLKELDRELAALTAASRQRTACP